MTVKIKLDTVNGSLVQNKTYVPTRAGIQTIKLTELTSFHLLLVSQLTSKIQVKRLT